MTLVERTHHVTGEAPAAFGATGARVWRSQLLQVALIAFGITASDCTSESPAPVAAAASDDGDGVASGMGVAGAGAGREAVAASPAPSDTSESESSSAEGAGPVPVLAPTDTASDPGSAEASAGGGSAGASVAPTSGSDAGKGGEAAEPEPERIVLFDGTSLDEWQSLGGGAAGWQLPGDGTMVVVAGSGYIVTRRTFEDVFVHVEYKTPTFPPNVTGQARGNSGIYLNAMYELQVLDSFGLPPAIDGCGAIYQVSVPSSTACYAQEVWNTYEIEFQTARWDAQGNKQAQARVLSAYLNGVLVQQDVDIPNSTGSGQPEVPGPAPLMLQDHGDRVAFRNIWVIPR
jgi:hypothetical protein